MIQLNLFDTDYDIRVMAEHLGRAITELQKARKDFQHNCALLAGCSLHGWTFDDCLRYFELAEKHFDRPH